jgi:arylsulfatase A-like enzyme
MPRTIKISTALQVFIVLAVAFILALIYFQNRSGSADNAVEILKNSNDEIINKYENKIASLRNAAREQRGLLPKLNIIYILIDTLRADHVGAYGYERETTPVIDKLAKEGCLFYDVSSQASWTKPSVASMFTSKYPGQLGMGAPTEEEPSEQNENEIRTPVLKDDETVIAEVLSAKGGYQTACVTANSWVEQKYGFQQGFDFMLHLCWKTQHEILFPRSDTSVTGSEQDWKRIPTAAEVTDGALMWLKNSLPYNKLGRLPDNEHVGEKRNNNKPLFMYLHYIDPHDPYTPPDEDLLRFRPDWDGGEKATRQYLEKIDAMTPKPPEEIQDYVTDLYDASIYYNDREIGRLLGEMRKMGYLDNAVVVIVADHGEGLWKHGQRGHGREVYQEQVHVPLIFWGSNYIKPNEAGGVGRLTQCLDISPTLLDIAGIEKPDEYIGHSLLPFIFGYDPKEPAIAFVEEYQEKTYLKSIRIDDHKLIRDMTSDNNGLFNREELYNIPEDYDEFNNLINNNDLAEEQKGLQSLLKLYTDSKFVSEKAAMITMDDASREALEALGYIDKPKAIDIDITGNSPDK